MTMKRFPTMPWKDHQPVPHVCSNPNCPEHGRRWALEPDPSPLALWHLTDLDSGRRSQVATVKPTCPRCGSLLIAETETQALPLPRAA